MVRNPETAMIAKRALETISPELKTVADDVGVSYASVMAWRVGRRSPGPDNLYQLAMLADKQADALRGVAVELRQAASSTTKEYP